MQSRHLPLSLSTVFLDCIALQVDRAAFHETVAAERARELLAREQELQEARLREAALEQHIRQLEQEVGAVRDAARAVRREEADQSQVVEGLQQQLEQMQLLALSQSREAETAMVAIADFKGVRVWCALPTPRHVHSRFRAEVTRVGISLSLSVDCYICIRPSDVAQLLGLHIPFHTCSVTYICWNMTRRFFNHFLEL